MRIKRNLVLLLACIVLLTVVACNFDANAYKALAIGKTSYTTAMNAAGDLQRQGKISDAEVAKIISVARIYYQVYLVAESAYEVYHANPTVANQDQLLNLITDVAAKLGELSALLIPYNVTIPQITVPTK